MKRARPDRPHPGVLPRSSLSPVGLPSRPALRDCSVLAVYAFFPVSVSTIRRYFLRLICPSHGRPWRANLTVRTPRLSTLASLARFPCVAFSLRSPVSLVFGLSRCSFASLPFGARLVVAALRYVFKHTFLLVIYA